MAIKPFVYVAAAGMTVGLLIVSGGVLGRMADRHSTPVAAEPSAARTLTPWSGPMPSLGATSPSGGATSPWTSPSSGPATSSSPSPGATVSPPATPAPTPTAEGSPIQVLGIQPPRMANGGGPFGTIVGTGSNTVALTFDDGPSPDWTPQILDILRQSGIKATFCLIGQNVEEYPDLVRAIVADGHTLCNHTWDHNLLLGDLSEDGIRSDIQRTSDAIRAAAPEAQISYFRAPGGNWTAPIVEVARQLGMAALDWTVDPRDWTVPETASIVSQVTSQCVDGAIFLLHDGGGDRSHTIEAVREFLPKLSTEHTFIPLPTGGA